MSGLEAIGVAASIIQVADLGTKLSVQLFSFYRQYKNASDSIQLLSNEIALVSAILRELGDNLKEEESSKLCSEEAFRTLRLVLSQCQGVLGQIQRVIEGNDQPGKSRFQQVNGRFRIVLLEPTLDQLKINLERLKSTMLLLLNVIMYAGQIRSNIVPGLVQEQRDLIQSLLNDRQVDSPKPRPLNEAAESPWGFSTQMIQPRDNFAPSGTVGSPRWKQTPNEYLISKKQSPRGSKVSRNNSVAQHNEPPELKEYNVLIQNILHEIESSSSKLEKTRHSRIKDGVLNIHSGEIMRFISEYGPSIDIDHSLFAEQNSETVLKSELTDSLLRLNSQLLSQSAKPSTVYFGSGETEFSESDIAAQGRQGRIPYRPRQRTNERLGVPVQQHSREHRSTSPDDWSEADIARDRQGRTSAHRSPRTHERSRMSVQQSSPSYRLSGDTSSAADGQRIYKRGATPALVSSEYVPPMLNSHSRNIRPRRKHTYVSDSDEEDVESSRRRRASGEVTRDPSPPHRDRYLRIDQRILEKSDPRLDMEIWKHDQAMKRLECEQEKQCTRANDGHDTHDREARRLHAKMTLDEDEISARLRRLERFESKGRPDEEREQMEYRRRLKQFEEVERRAAARREISRYKKSDTTGTASKRNDEGCEAENESESAMFERRGDDTQGQTLSDLSLPDNLEDLLAQWTTLAKHEIQRGRIMH